MIDYSIINQIIEEIVRAIEPLVQTRGTQGYYEFLNKIITKDKEKPEKTLEEKLLPLFNKNMDGYTARTMLMYFIVQSRYGKPNDIREDIKTWVIDSLEKALNGEKFEKAFSLIIQKPKTDFGKKLQIAAYFSLLYDHGIPKKTSYQEAQIICAEKWSVSERTVATIREAILIPTINPKTLEALTEIDFSDAFSTAT